MKGWVYVITNKAMPGLVKVGYSTKDPELRARELDGTHLPHPNQVTYEILIDNPQQIEQQTHRALSRYKERNRLPGYNTGQEWFRCFGRRGCCGH